MNIQRREKYYALRWARKVYDDIRFEPYLLEIHLHSFRNINTNCQTCRLSQPISPKAAWVGCSVCSRQCSQVAWWSKTKVHILLLPHLAVWLSVRLFISLGLNICLHFKSYISLDLDVFPIFKYVMAISTSQYCLKNWDPLCEEAGTELGTWEAPTKW